MLRLILIVPMAVIHMLFASSGIAQQRADCAVPPGGTITCEAGQAAICKVDNGRVYGSCKTPPASLKGDELKAWTVSEATGFQIDPGEVATDKYSAILWSGQWNKNGNKTTFQPPQTSSLTAGPDDRLRFAVGTAIYRDPRLTKYAAEASIKVNVKQQHVMLSGDVWSTADSAQAEAKAKAVSGEGTVTNDLKVLDHRN